MPERSSILGTWLPADHGRQPPGMTWEDWQAWRPWLEGPGRAWERYTYDVELYIRDLELRAPTPALMRMWARNNGKRIDAVSCRGLLFDLFEARRGAGWSAVGQLLGYRDLWLLNFPALALGSLYLVSETCDDAVRALAARHGIFTWCTGETAPS